MSILILEQVDRITKLLEAQIPANPGSPRNQKLQNKLECNMAKYFLDLGNAFPYSRIANIYNKYVEKE